MFKKKKQQPAILGYQTGFSKQYELGTELGRGGNGVVRLCRHKDTGRSYAVKSIVKVLIGGDVSDRKKAGQIPYLKREVEVLLALRGTLNVANLHGVYEDATHVHLVMELCAGGELLARTAAPSGKPGSGAPRAAAHNRSGAAAAPSRYHYSERTAASFLRAVLRTVAQCHAKRIIHRDIKPENFLLLSEEEAAPVKAVDFGLAIFFDPAHLPVTGLNPEGTPWYLAPECCRAKWWPASDVWAVGVMACYLLSGAYPFLDRLTPKMPDLARTLRSICFEEVDLGRSEFSSLSPEAKEFISALLVKDPLQRPSAEQALRHPFLRGGAADRAAGKPLDQTVVQRIQRFAQSSLFKRTVLEHIAHDLLSMHFAVEPSVHGAAVFKERSVRGGQALLAAERSIRGGQAMLAAERSVRGGGLLRVGRRGSGNSSLEGSRRGSGAAADRSTQGGAEALVRAGSIHGGAEALSRAGSTHGGVEAMARAGSGGPAAGTPAAGTTGMSRSRSASVLLPVATPYSQRLARLFDELQLQPEDKVDRAKLQKALGGIGYNLAEDEAQELFDVVDVEARGAVARADIAAGLIDWKAFQDSYKDRWLEAARRAFAELDTGGRGELGAAEIASAFGSHLTPYEVDAAVHQALLEATGDAAALNAVGDVAAGAASPRPVGGGDDGGAGSSPFQDAPLSVGGFAGLDSTHKIDFNHFLALLRGGNEGDDIGDGLDKFESRLMPSRMPSLRADDLPTVTAAAAAAKQKPSVANGGGGGAAAGGCCSIS